MTVREQLIEDRNEEIRQASSVWRSEYAKANALLQRGNPGDAAAAARIREKALSIRRATVELINRDFYTDYRKLLVQAAKNFKQKQRVARQNIQQESPELFRSLAAMRQLIDELQTEVEKSGLIDAAAEDNFHLKNLEAVVSASKGFYLTRSYQALDESSTWESFLESLHPEAQRRWHQAYDVFKSELEEAEVDRIVAADPNRSRASARSMVRRMNMIKPQQVVERARNFLASFIKDGPPGLAPGAININVLKPRNLELKRGLREYVGQYEVQRGCQAPYRKNREILVGLIDS